MIGRDGRHCDRCGVLLTRKNNKCGFELCDNCNDAIELEVKEEQESRESEGENERIL